MKKLKTKRRKAIHISHFLYDQSLVPFTCLLSMSLFVPWIHPDHDDPNTTTLYSGGYCVSRNVRRPFLLETDVWNPLSSSRIVSFLRGFRCRSTDHFSAWTRKTYWFTVYIVSLTEAAQLRKYTSKVIYMKEHHDHLPSAHYNGRGITNWTTPSLYMCIVGLCIFYMIQNENGENIYTALETN